MSVRSRLYSSWIVPPNSDPPAFTTQHTHPDLEKPLFAEELVPGPAQTGPSLTETVWHYHFSIALQRGQHRSVLSDMPLEGSWQVVMQTTKRKKNEVIICSNSGRA
ncbi:hypothetical protein AAFF_G00252500 [Aldrovandia affinis]|uniref:Uncharacterized protein n=1 Tax=Aldrovandia affinis TaxID=143900 RepID=A0AAD7WTN6_9TELE|nr:hypothetical protein AAFF_G00252500 [Aldrovandia affinis]